MIWNLAGRKVLITGGTRGIGAACVKAFASQGANVAINYMSSEAEAAALARQISDNHGVKACAVQGDMAKKADNHNVVRKTVEELGGLDIVISNAGNSKAAPLNDIYALTEEDWDHTWNVLVKSNVFLFQEALPVFQQNPDGGCFLITSSLAGLIPNGSSMAYAVCRAAGNHLTRCLAQSQGPKVRVNAVCPGLVDTERTKVFTEEQRQGFKDMAVLKRVTTVEEIAETFIYLAKNTGITGECLRVDSGMAIC